MTTSGETPSGPWNIEFFQRVPDDVPTVECPTRDFLESVPVQVATEIDAVLHAVADGPPPSFRGGGKWKAMHGDMSRFNEVCVAFGRFNYRVFCLLVRDAGRFASPTIVCLGGLVKPKRSAADAKDYELIRTYRDEFLMHGTVL